MGLLPDELVEARDRERVGRRGLRRGHPDGEQRLAQLRTRQPELAHVERVDGVDAVGDEGALPPVQHVLAEPEIDGRAARLERDGDVGVEHADVAPHPLLGLVAQLGALQLAVPVLVVDEARGPDERAEPVGPEVDIGGELGRVGDDAAVVVEIAVVAVGLAGQRPVALPDAEGHALGDRGVDAPPVPAVAELDRARRRGFQESAENSGARRQRHRGNTGAARARQGFAARRRGAVGFGHVLHAPLNRHKLLRIAKCVTRDIPESIF